MFVQNFHEFIKVPVFAVQSLYDSFSIPNIMGVSCIPNGLASCSEEDRDLIEDNRRNVTDVLRRIGKKPRNGVWGLGCVRHGGLDVEYLSPRATIPAHSNYTSGFSVEQWM